MQSRRFLAALALPFVALAVTACGSDEPAASPVAERTAVVETPVAETTSEAVSEPVEVPTEVIRVGVEQVLHVAGQAVRVKVQSYDPADDGVAIEVNSGAAPFVVDCAAFVLVDADGTEIVGVPSNPLWDRDLAADDQTIGQVRFIGATAPVSITYSPDGADEPLVWSF